MQNNIKSAASDIAQDIAQTEARLRPMLSEFVLPPGDGYAFTIGAPCEFRSAREADTGANAVEDAAADTEPSQKQTIQAMELNEVNKGVGGSAKSRESIPSVYSQHKAFQIIIEDASLRQALPALWQQWKGALALALLYPFYQEQTGPLAWETIAISGDTPFMKTASALPGGPALQAIPLLLRRNTDSPQPLLAFDELVLAVPSAYDMPLSDFHFPWMSADASLYSDPLPQLSIKELQLLKDTLKQPLPNGFPRANGVERFLAEINQHLDTKANLQDEKNCTLLLIRGLLMQDIIPTQLWVRTLKHNDLPDSTCPLECAAHTLYTQHQYAVCLEDRTIAYISQDCLLWIPDRHSLESSPAFKKMVQNCEDTLQQESAKHYLAHKGYRLRSSFPHMELLQDVDWIPSQMPLENNVTMRWRPKRKRPGQKPLPEPWTCFEPALLIDESPDTVFCQKLVSTNARRHSQGSIDKVYQNQFFPLDTYGAIAYMKAHHENRQPFCQVQCATTGDSATATFRFKLHATQPLWLECEQPYSQIIYIPQTDLPNVALWPNAKVRTTAVPWKAYYLFACFPTSSSANAMDTIAYDSQYHQIPQTQRASYTEALLQAQSGQSINRKWQTYHSTHFPSLMRFSHNDISIGTALFADTREEWLPNTGTESYALAVDFGTTGTIGAYVKCTAEGHSTSEPTYPSLSENILRWQRATSSVYDAFSGEFFIDPALGVSTTTQQRDPVVFTALKRFMSKAKRTPPSGNMLHLDGNINYFSETKILLTTTAFETKLGFKILKDEADSHPHHANSYLFLRQLLQFYFLELRQRGAKEVNLRFASPLAFSADDLGAYRTIFEKVAQDVAQETGLYLKGDTVWVTSESLAVGAYFTHAAENSLYEGLNLKDGILILDIGGGTSDYSLSQRDDTGCINATICASTFLAGHLMVAHHIVEILKQPGLSLEWFFGGLQRGDLPNVKELKEKLTASGAQEETVNTLMDHLLKYNTKAFKAMLYQSNEGSELYLSILTYQLALLFWVACQIYLHNAEIQQSVVTLCLAGNGALLYYELMIPERQNLICSAAPSTPIQQLKVLTQTRNSKREVVEGLLRDTRIFEGKVQSQKEDASAKKDDLRKELVAFHIRYMDLTLKAFPNDVIAKDLQSYNLQADKAESQAILSTDPILGIQALNKQLWAIRNSVCAKWLREKNP